MGDTGISAMAGTGMERCVDTGEAPGVPFGRLLRRYRASAGLTQEELAARSGVSVRALSDMERGRTARPFSHSVRLLADALELDEQARARLTAAVHEGTDEAPVPRELPPPVPAFTGRSGALRMPGDRAAAATSGAAFHGPVGRAADAGRAGGPGGGQRHSGDLGYRRDRGGGQ